MSLNQLLHRLISVIGDVFYAKLPCCVDSMIPLHDKEMAPSSGFLFIKQNSLVEQFNDFLGNTQSCIGLKKEKSYLDILLIEIVLISNISTAKNDVTSS